MRCTLVTKPGFTPTFCVDGERDDGKKVRVIFNSKQDAKGAVITKLADGTEFEKPTDDERKELHTFALAQINS